MKGIRNRCAVQSSDVSKEMTQFCGVHRLSSGCQTMWRRGVVVNELVAIKEVALRRGPGYYLDG